jgi:hypothetical protein
VSAVSEKENDNTSQNHKLQTFGFGERMVECCVDGNQTNVRGERGGEAVVNTRSTILREETFAPQLADNTN